MLSILIPTHNRRCVTLCEELRRQAVALEASVGLEWELIVLEDGTNDMGVLATNSHLDELVGCRHVVLPRNVGTSRCRNRLIREAQGDRLLFLDSDVWPCRDTFLRDYVMPGERSDVLVGGVSYRRGADQVANPLRLRWGLANEALSARQRQREPYAHMLTSNFLLSRRAAAAVRFDETLDRYGHENTALGAALHEAGMHVEHLDNPVFHDDDDTAEEFLIKTRTSLQSLNLHKDRLRSHSDALQQHDHLVRLHLAPLMRWLFRHWRDEMEHNLEGPSPSLWVFRLYRVSYLCCVMGL